MPCYDYMAKEREQNCADVQKRLDNVTALLCAVGRAVASGVPIEDGTRKELAAWWARHAAEDAKRGEPWRARP